MNSIIEACRSSKTIGPQDNAVAMIMLTASVDAKGRVVESYPPRKLVVTWNIDGIEELKKLPEAIVTYEIEPEGELVRLTMTESHPTPIPGDMLEGGRRSRPVILCGLKSLLETGRVPKIPPPQPPSKPVQ